jgi:pimeloyl-ACP methyl ester carboxylesterase
MIFTSERLMTTFVLVHGAFHGGWCYSRVAAKLREQRHDVYTPTLSGLGERAHLAGQTINLSTHIQDIVAVIQSHNLNDVILCGHSYGGMVITGVAGQVGERIRTLFYLDACVPENEQSLFDIIGPERALLSLQAAGETGTMMVSPGAEFFQVNPGDIEWVDKLCTPHPVGCFIQKLRYTGKEALVTRRTYVLCERWSSVNHPTYARVKDLPGWRAVSLDCGHDVMVDDPDALGALLLEEVGR